MSKPMAGMYTSGAGAAGPVEAEASRVAGTRDVRAYPTTPPGQRGRGSE